MKYLQGSVEFTTKAFGDAGTFEGYAAIFGNIDLGGDILERGAFKEIAKNDDGRVIVLNQHAMRDPIGTAEVEEDSKGLHFRGNLILEAPNARTAYALMRGKALTGMSFGYDVLPGGAEVLNTGVRKLKAVKLWEISPVTFGMNPLAGVADVKHILRDGKLPSLPEFEEFLREAGFSRTQATAIAGKGLSPLLQSESGSKAIDDIVRQSLAILRGEPS
jgi:HK97 family phage prohead protease